MKTGRQRTGQSIRKRITVLLVDDHPCVLEGVRIWLKKNKDIKVVGIAENGDGAAIKTRRLSPDIVILDLSLPGSNGLHVMKRIQDENMYVKVIIYSMHEESEFVQASIEAGAKGYVLKSSPPSELLLAIEAVQAGGQHFDKRIRSMYRSEKVSKARRSNNLDAQESPASNLADIERRFGLTKLVRSSNVRGCDRLIKDVTEYIERHSSPSLSVKQIGNAIKMDPSDLDRLFRRATGMTVKKHIDSKCKERVRERIHDGVWKGTQLAEEFGFRSDQSFYRWIRRVFGVSFKFLREQISTTEAGVLARDLHRLELGDQDN